MTALRAAAVLPGRLCYCAKRSHQFQPVRLAMIKWITAVVVFMGMACDKPSADKPATGPGAATARAAATYRVRGSAWVGRNDASSDLQRGLKVYLLRPSVSQKDALAAAKATAAQFGELAAGAAVNEGQKALKDPVATVDAYAFCETRSRQSPVRFDPIVTAATVASAATGADAKYEIGSVPAGDYVLYAELDTATLFVDWLIPVSVSGDVTIDLQNANARTVKNGRVNER